jgi:spore coat polysaccharide biosynthesis protein SpsF
MKIGAIIQARYQSTRLPGKVLLPLPFPVGKPLIQYITDAILQSKIINQICIATSTFSENDMIVDFANKHSLSVFRGNEEDVLSRFIAITLEHKFDVIVRLTGDNPLIDIKKLDEALKYHISEDNEYTKTEGLPLGMNFEIVNASTLLQLESEKLTNEDKEHVTKFINDHNKFKKAVYNFKTKNLSALRCTIDYPSDFAMMNLLLPLLIDNENISDQIDTIQKRYPWIFEINSNNYQVKYYDTIEEELKIVMPILKRMEMNNLIKFIISLPYDNSNTH